jgi:hypothetical protein
MENITLTSTQIVRGFVETSDLQSALYSLYTAKDESGKGTNPIRFRVRGALNIGHMLRILAALPYNSADEKSIKKTGIKMSYPKEDVGALRQTFGSYANPRKLCAILCFFTGYELPVNPETREPLLTQEDYAKFVNEYLAKTGTMQRIPATNESPANNQANTDTNVGARTNEPAAVV